MNDLLCKTYMNRSPRGLIRVLFVAREEDRALYYEEIADLILGLQKNLAIYTALSPEDVPEEILRTMRLVIAPVTMAFLHPDCRERTEIFQKAIELGIPILPIQKQKGVGRIFSEVCGKLQVIDGTGTDDTAIDLETKLKRFLDDVLVSEEMTKRIRDAFDAYIFLSYRKKDRKHVDRIMRLIHENEFMRDVAVWYDEYLVPGEKYNDAIRDALLKSKLVALVVTPNLVNEDNYVQRVEYPMARENGKPVLPIEAERTDTEKMHEQYQEIPEPVRIEDTDTLAEALEKAFAAADPEKKEELQHSLKKVLEPETADPEAGDNGLNNDPAHLFCMGLAYLMGIDVEIDLERAEELLLTAYMGDMSDPFNPRKGGCDEAGELLVDCYMEGRYLDADYDKAYRLQRHLVSEKKMRLEFAGGTREDYLRYAALLHRKTETIIAANGYCGEALDTKSEEIEILEKIAESFPAPVSSPSEEVELTVISGATEEKMTVRRSLADLQAVTEAKKEKVRMLCRVPESEEGQEYLFLCQNIWDFYSSVFNHFGKYDPAFDVAGLALDFSRVCEQFGNMESMWFTWGRSALSTYYATEKEISEEYREELIRSTIRFWLDWITWLNDHYTDGGESYYRDSDMMQSFKKGATFLDGFREMLADQMEYISKVLLDRGDEDGRILLRQHFFSTFGTMLMNMEHCGEARELLLAAVEELMDKQEESPDLIFLQQENCENLIRLGEMTGDMFSLAGGYMGLELVYLYLYDATGKEVFQRKLEEVREILQDPEMAAYIEETMNEPEGEEDGDGQTPPDEPYTERTDGHSETVGEKPMSDGKYHFLANENDKKDEAASKYDFVGSKDEEAQQAGPTRYSFLTERSGQLDPREAEPIYNYQFTTGAEDDDLTLEIPGYFKGAALVKELHYNGGEHAIFVRNQHQLLLCDYIHPEIRQLLAQTVDIFISETDSKQEYMARVVHDDIDELAAKALELHDYRFEYHPFPIADGTLTLGNERCEICGQKKGIYYIDPSGTDDLGVRKNAKILCPHCIQENRENLFWNLAGQFRSICGDRDVYFGGLPFFDHGKDASFWAIHCDHLAIYLGELEPEDLNPRLHEEILKTWNWHVLNIYADMDPAETLGMFDRGRLHAYLFKCKKCGKKLLAFSGIMDEIPNIQ